MTDKLLDSETPPGTPRWVKVLVVAVIIAILLGIVIMLIIGGDHGTGSHVPGLVTGSTLPVGYLGPVLSASGAITPTGGGILSEGDQQ